jgi:prevent-host-death family protein
MPSEVGIRELKNGASAYIERVEHGEVITVTRRGKPVARIVPAEMPRGLARLMAEGRLSWDGGKPDLQPPRVKLRGDGPTAADYVIEGRR